MENQTVQTEKKNIQIKYYETEIAKKVKTQFPDIEEIKFADTSIDPNTGFWISSFTIKASWTKDMPQKDTRTVAEPFTPKSIKEGGVGIGIVQIPMQQYYKKGKTTQLITVVYSIGGEKKL